MPYRLKGILKLPNSAQVAAGADIEFISRRNYSPLLMDLSSVIKTSSTGAYDITLEFGEYAVVLYWGCSQPSHIGKLFVFADTAEGLDLQTLLQQADWQPATPEYVQQIQGWLAEGLANATKAEQSAVRAKASELLVEQDREEVASNKTIVVSAQEDVTAKHADVVEKADQVAANTAIVNGKVPLAIAAADTASQKAVESSEGASTATDAALRAENAALAMVGAILDGGQCDLSSGFYPPALTVNGKKYSTVWYVQTGGTVAGTKYDVGDKLQYTTANDGFYFRIDARDDVVSVNGEKGAVTLTAQKVGADASGTASSIMSQHKSESSAHTPQNVGADPAGTAASLMTKHEEKAGAHDIEGVTGLQDALNEKYGKSNIIGSVSESEGVPTGAIIQRGSNANGSFVKFADGTQICKLNIELSTLDLGTNGPNLLIERIWAFPAPFSSQVCIDGNAILGSGNLPIKYSHRIQGGVGVSSAAYAIRTDASAPSSGYGVVIDLTAIGRWY